MIHLIAVVSASLCSFFPQGPQPDAGEVGMELRNAGTEMAEVAGVINADALISGIPSDAAELDKGSSHFVMKLSGPSIIREISFINDGLGGKASLSVSANGTDWTPLLNVIFAAADRKLSLRPGMAQGRYVKMSFDLATGGNLRAFTVKGQHSAANYRVQQREGMGVPVDFLSGMTGAKVVWYSGVVESSDCSPAREVVVYDLGTERSLNEFHALYSKTEAAFSIYTITQAQAASIAAKRSSTILGNLKPVKQVRDSHAKGMASGSFPAGFKTRFLAFGIEVPATETDFSLFRLAFCGDAVTQFNDGKIAVISGLPEANTGDGLVSSVLGLASDTVAAGSVKVFNLENEADLLAAVLKNAGLGDWAQAPEAFVALEEAVVEPPPENELPGSSIFNLSTVDLAAGPFDEGLDPLDAEPTEIQLGVCVVVSHGS